MTHRFFRHLSFQYALVLALLLISNFAFAQNAARFPATVKPVNGGVEVIAYNGADRLLQRGDIISWVATPDSDNQVAVKSAAALEAEFSSKRGKDGVIALWVTRGNEEPDWIFLKVVAQPKSGSLPLEVRQGEDAVEVVTYSGQDGKLKKGDVISYIATPGRDVQVAVNTPAIFEAEVVAKKSAQGTIALWVTRGNAEPEWVTISVQRAGNGVATRPGMPPSTTTADSTGKLSIRPASEDAAVLHVLYIYDPKAENDAFRWGCEFDVYRMSAYLSGSTPNGMYDGKTFATPSQDAGGLLQAIRDYRDTISSNDSLLVYYSGHGSNDGQTGHMLDLRPGVKVARSDVRKAMEDTGARLCLLITDCCANGSKQPFRRESGIRQIPPTFWNTSCCRALFFEHEGFVDVTSCGPGELAWSVGPTDENGRFIGGEVTDGEDFNNGGLFTTSLLRIMTLHDGDFKRNNLLDSAGRISWESIKRKLVSDTEFTFQAQIFPAFRKQRDKDKNKHQTVTFLSTGKAVGKALPATGQSVLGISLIEDGGSVIAGDVDSDRMPAWVGLKPGDKLISARIDTDSYYAHFWNHDRIGFDGPDASTAPEYLPIGMQPLLITSKESLRDLSQTKAAGSGEPASGMWIFTVARDGVSTEVYVRIVEEHSLRYDVTK